MTDGTPGPQIPPEFLVTRQGSTFVTFRGLVHLAHLQGLSATSTHLVQLPTAENGMTAIVTALVTTEKGTFAGTGDADPGNVPKMIAPHLLRMAETRALARAFRVAVDAAHTALEELGDDSPAPPGRSEAFPPEPPAPGGEGPDRIRIGEQVYTRAQVWGGYQARRSAALAAGVIGTGDRLASYVPESRLSELAGAAQALRRRMEPPPELEGAVDEDGHG